MSSGTRSHSRMRLPTSAGRTAALALAALACGALSFWGGGQIGRALWKKPALSSTIRLFREPRPVPLFVAPALDGHLLSSGDWRGRVTIVSFWATWCMPCLQEAADFVALRRRYPGRVEVIGLSVDEGDPDTVRAWVAAHGVDYPVAIANAALQARFGGIEAVPTSFVLDAEGRIVQKHVGLYPAVVYDLAVRALAGLPVDAVVERVGDAAEVALGEGAQLTEIPGVDLSDLEPAARASLLERLNTDRCPCGCAMTLARCRKTDPTCDTSLPIVRAIVDRARRQDADPGPRSARDAGRRP